MDIQEYLESIGRIKNQKPEPSTKTSFSKGNEAPAEALPEQKNLGDVFDYYYKKGCKSMPAGIQINADKWEGNIL